MLDLSKCKSEVYVDQDLCARCKANLCDRIRIENGISKCPSKGDVKPRGKWVEEKGLERKGRERRTSSPFTSARSTHQTEERKR